nr:hypothetical protein [Lachnospiraceae bacterium]
PELGCREEQYRREAEEFFKKIKGVEKEIETEDPVSPYEEVLRGFSDECRGKGISPAPGSDGRKSLLISNAIYLSSWEGRSVRIPVPGTQEEKDFERLFEKHLNEKRGK